MISDSVIRINISLLVAFSDHKRQLCDVIKIVPIYHLLVVPLPFSLCLVPTPTERLHLAHLIMSSPPLPSLFLFFFSLFAFIFTNAVAQVATPPFSDCFSGNASFKLNISTVYAQITTSPSLGRHLNITLLGESPQPIEGTANTSSDLGACHCHISVYPICSPLS